MPHTVREKTVGWSAKDFDPNAAYDVLLAAAEGTWGMKTSEVEEFISQIEWHESRGDHTAKQKVNVYAEDGKTVIGSSEGPGRGLFQYEIDWGGKQRGGKTARNRFANWMLKTQGIDVGAIPEDFSKIGPQLQRAIFLADALAKGGDPNQGTLKWWLEKHWAGAEADIPDRTRAFEESMQSKYDNY